MRISGSGFPLPGFSFALEGIWRVIAAAPERRDPGFPNIDKGGEMDYIVIG